MREGQLSRQQLAQALKVQGLLGDRLGTTLLEEGLVAEDILLNALGRQRSTQTVSAAELASVPPEVVRLIPARLAERYGVVPFQLEGRTLSVASMNGGDLLKEDEIGFLTSCMVRTCIALEMRISEALERYYRIACPQRHQALARRLVARPAPPTAEQLAASPNTPSVLPAAARTPASPKAVATARGRAAALPPAPAAPPPPRFIELDEEDAALLGTSSSDSPWTPPSEEPVLLKPAPLPWLARNVAAPAVAAPPPVAETPPIAETPPVAETPPAGEAAAALVATDAPESPPAAAGGGEAGPEASLEEGMRRAASGLKAAEIRDDIADVLLAFCEPYLQRRMVLVTRKDHIVGWRGEGEGVESQRVRAIEIPTHDPSVFLGLTGAGSFWLGSLPPLEANRRLVDGLGGTAPKDCLVLPVTLRSRVVCYLYGDNFDHGVAGAPIAELRRLAAKAGLAFQIYILKNKLRVL